MNLRAASGGLGHLVLKVPGGEVGEAEELGFFGAELG